MMAMEEHSRDQSCLPGTSDSSKTSSENATSSVGALATPLHTNNQTIGSSDTLKLSSWASDSSKISTRYRATFCEPELLGLVEFLEASEVELSTEAEHEQVRDTQTSNDLEIVKSPDLARSTNFASLFAPLSNHSSSLANISTFRVQEFQHFNQDGTSEKLYAIVSNRPTDVRLQLFGDFFSLQSRNDFLRAIMMEHHGGLPNTAGTESHFTPTYPLEVLNSANSPADEKVWELGFKTRILQHSHRISPTNSPTLIRYKMIADQNTFDTFQGKEHIEGRERAAWIAISSTINTNLQHQAVSPTFDKLATDFFGGKEVREDYSYALEADARLMDGSTGTKNHAITYNGGESSEAVWQECCSNPGFARFIMDLALCNDIEKARLRGSPWYGAKVHCLAIDIKSGKAEVSALLETLKGIVKETSKLSDLEEPNTNAAMDLSAIGIYEVVSLDTESNDVLDAQNSDATNPANSPPASEHGEKSKKQRANEGGDEWMNTSRGQQTEKASLKASRKGNKNRSMAIKKASQVKSTLDTDSDNESPVSEEPEAPANTTASKPSLDEEETGNWSVVPKKVPPGQGRPLNGLSTAASHGTGRGSYGGQFKQLGPVFNQNRASQVPSKGFSAQLQRRDAPNIAKSKDDTMQSPLIGSKAGHVPSQKAAATQSSQNPAQIQKPAPKESKLSRTFVAEEYPALTTRVSVPVSLSVIEPDSQTAPTTQHIKNNPIAQDLPKVTSRPQYVTRGCEKKLVSTSTSSVLPSIGCTRKSFDVDAYALIKTTANRLAIPPVADSSSPKTVDNHSDNISARSDREAICLEHEDQEESICELPSKSLRKPEEVERSEDGQNSEHSSTTIQADIARSPEVRLSPEFKRSDNSNDEYTIPTAMAVAEDQAPPSYAEKEYESETADTASDESEDSEDDMSNADILASPSQRKSRAITPSIPALNGCDSELVSSNDSPSTLKAQPQSSFPAQHKEGISEIGLDARGRIRDGVSNISDLKPGQYVDEPAFVINEAESINISATSTQALGLTSSILLFLLLIEAEAARVVSTKNIKIRSATHSSGGVKIPNFYSISSDDEDSDGEMAASKAKSSKVASTETPKIRSATHSAKTGAAIPNFFYVSTDYEDSDVEKSTMKIEEQGGVMNIAASAFETKIPPSDGNHTHDLSTPGYTEPPLHVVDARTSDSQTILLSLDDSHIQEPYTGYIELAPGIASAFETILPPPNCDYAQELMDLAFVLDASASDDQMNRALSDGNHTHVVTDNAPITTACALDQMSVPIPGGNYTQDSACFDHIESEPQEGVMNGTTVASGPHTDSQSPNEDQAQQSLRATDTESVQVSASYVSHDLQYPSQPDEASYHSKFFDLRLGMASSDQSFYRGPPLLNQRHLVVPQSAYTSFNSGVRTSQPILPAESPYKQGEGQYTGDGTVGSRNLGRPMDPSPAGMDRMVTQTQNASQFTVNCTYCGERTTPSIQAPQVLCSGCGPTSMIRYCSVACLLVDSLAHSGHCMNYSASDRAAFHSLPGMFIYITNPIMSEFGYSESPERFRQRAFSMYCSSGPFPKLFMAWMMNSAVILTGQQDQHAIDPNETVKRTGDYAIFRSNVTLDSPRSNPSADVIYTIKFHRVDPMKQIFNRTLNACYLVWDSRIVEFLYRLIRHLILDEEYFSMFKYRELVEVVWPEFEHQFKQEFNFDFSMQTCTTPRFDAGAEWQWISGLVANLEYRYPVLSQWFGH